MKGHILNTETEQQINNFAEAFGLVVLELNIRKAPENKILEVIVDNKNQGVSLSNITELSRKINEFIDSNETGIEGNFRLEVTSPGVDYPLKHEWQFVKNIGRLIGLVYEDNMGNHAKDLFRLVGIDDNRLVLESYKPSIKGQKSREPVTQVMIPISKIGQAVVEIEF